MPRYSLRSLLILLVVALPGCHGKTARKIETVRGGAEAVDRHAHEIEQIAEPNP